MITGQRAVSCYKISIVLCAVSSTFQSPHLPKKLSQQFSFTIHKKIRCVVKWSSPFPLSFFLFVLSLLVEQYYLHDMGLIFFVAGHQEDSFHAKAPISSRSKPMDFLIRKVTLHLINESSFFVTIKI